MGIIAYSSPFVQGEGKGKQRCRVQNNGYVACLTRETCERLFSSGQACANTVARLNALNNSKYHLTFVIYPTTRPHTLATPFPDIRTTNENRNCSPGAAPAYTSQILVHRVPVRHCQSAHFYQLSSKLRHLVLNTKLASSLPVFPFHTNKVHLPLILVLPSGQFRHVFRRMLLAATAPDAAHSATPALVPARPGLRKVAP